MSSLLYYPFISIPKTNWLSQALLYWDGIATIVPNAELRRQTNITPFARSLIRNDIIQTVSPEEYAYARPDCYIEFLQWVEQNRTSFLIDRYTPLQRVHSAKLDSMSIGKLGFLGEEFVEMGVAKRSDSCWYVMRSDLSMYYMTFLAILIGQETGRIPATDRYKGISHLVGINESGHGHDFEITKAMFRDAILSELLPVPCGVEDYQSLARFKDKYHDELLSFRKDIESFLISLSPYGSEEQRELCQLFIEKANDQVEEIKGKMHAFKFPEVNLGTVIAALPVIECVKENSMIGAGIGIASVILQMIFNPSKQENRNKPFAYAALYDGRRRSHPEIINNNRLNSSYNVI